MKWFLIILILLIPVWCFAVESQERLNSFDSVERNGSYRKYYAGVEQGADKVRISVTPRWYKLTADKKKDFMKQVGTLFVGMGSARGFKESGSLFVFSFVDKKTGETVGTLTSLTGPEIYK